MTLTRTLCLILALLLAAGSAAARAEAMREGQWTSYRDAYRAMLWFEKYGSPKHLLVHHYQVQLRERGGTLEGVRLNLVGKTTRLNLPLDATGRTIFPLIKVAYDENAELVLSGKPGAFVLRSRVSIQMRPDGVYEATDLRTACEQLLAYQRYLAPRAWSGKKCSGVRLTYARSDAATVVTFKTSEREAPSLAASDGGAFQDEQNERFKTINYVFSAWPEKGQLLTHSAPLAISALFE